MDERDTRPGADRAPNANRWLNRRGLLKAMGIGTVGVAGSELLVPRSAMAVRASSHAPTPPWVERFEGSAGASSDAGETAWTVESADSHPDVGVRSESGSGSLTFRRTAGSARWTSEPIDISGGPVDLSITVRGSGSLSAPAGGTAPEAIGDGDAPTDPDLDGIYEDVTGDGAVDDADVRTLLDNFWEIGLSEHVSAFDGNCNGRLDYGDAVRLAWTAGGSVGSADADCGGTGDRLEIAVIVDGEETTVATYDGPVPSGGDTVDSSDLIGETLQVVVKATSVDPDAAYHVDHVAVLEAAESLPIEQPPSDGSSSGASFASRTTGIAPLAVFFDALTDGAGVIQPPEVDGHPDFASFRYEWFFGDENAGTWRTTGASRNRATGPMAAHVFEEPGTYEVTLRVTDAGGTVHQYTQEIEVSPFHGTTYYVSSSAGSDDNDGLSRDSPLATYDEAISVADANTRVLFERGDTWSTDGNQSLGDGPGILGAYGVGPKPHVRVESANAALRVRGDDWRVEDLHFSNDPDGNNSSGVNGNTAGGTSKLLLHRVEVEGFRVGIGWSQWEDNLHRNVFVVDCHVHDQDVNGMYAGGEHLALLGTRVVDPEGSHVVRLWQARRSVIGHNELFDPEPTRHALKFHSPEAEDQSDGWLDTAYSVVSHNRFRGGTWCVGLGPQNNTSDERVHDVLFEDNTLRAGPDTRILLNVWGRRMTVRRNLFVGTGSTNRVEAFEVTQRGIEPAPDGNELHHNVAYRGAADPAMEYDVAGDALETSVHHNLLSYPGASLGEFDVANATSDANHTCPPDEFVDADGEDFRLLSDSALLEQGFERNVLQR